MQWYTQSAQELYKKLHSSDRGISHDLAKSRLAEFGPNVLAVKKEPLWRVIIEPFRSIFIIILGIAAAISLLSHEPLDATIIFIIILINAIIFYTQHYATTRVLRTLKQQTIGTVNVVRQGEQVTIPSTELVPGDLMLIAEGERIAADARITQSDTLQINEATLTGESVPVHKHASVLAAETPIFEQKNMIFQGTHVLTGGARALVIATGVQTEFGKIARLATDTTKSPVQVKIDRLIGMLIKTIVIISLVVFALSLNRGIAFGEALRFVISLCVSVVPEELPIALTVILVLGMRRMARKKALVRSFRAIEDIGLITTIATDKTGTLTKNHLTVVDSWAIGRADVKKLASHTLDPDAKATDPLEKAILEAVDATKDVDRVYPFDLKYRLSGAFVKKDKRLYLKGAPEQLLARSRLGAQQRQLAHSTLRELAAKGYRVIAIGQMPIHNHPPKDLGAIEKVEFNGFLAFADELRTEAAPAIKVAQEAGISVRLITGDHVETAYNIGQHIGLARRRDEVIEGTDLPEESAALAVVIRDKKVFARILPEDKFKILRALKETEITAMTGDGVNDVPALASAHVGIAMGSGSDIAKDAAGIVLLDDNFATIVRAISEGRKIYDNIRRMLFYVLSTSLGEVLTMIGALLLGLPLPVTALQILWINLVTDTAMVLPLGLEPEEEGHMKQPPRRPNEPLLGGILLSRMAVVGLTMAIVTLIIVAVLVARDHSLGYIQTTAFMALIVAQWMNAFNARSEFRSSFSRLRTMNRGLLVGLGLAAGLQALVMFGPLATVFDVTAVPLSTLMISSGGMMLAILASSELHKFVVRKFITKKPV